LGLRRLRGAPIVLQGARGGPVGFADFIIACSVTNTHAGNIPHCFARLPFFLLFFSLKKQIHV
jgi:hypothetical protein